MRRKQRVLITGATRGIGRATALHLARLGHHVIATGRNVELLAGLQALATKESLSLEAARLDVTDEAACIKTVDTCLNSGGLNALINNAGYGLHACLEEVALDEVRTLFETNVYAPLRLSQLVLPHMRKRGSGTIVNVGSVAGVVGVPIEGGYSASKFALRSISSAMRMEVATFGVRVVLIEPGVFETDFAENKVYGRNAFGEGSPYQQALRETSMRHMTRVMVARGPEAVAVSIRNAIESKRPRARYAVGIDGRAGAMAARLLPDSVLDYFLRRAILGS